jgi:hypothetical protein
MSVEVARTGSSGFIYLNRGNCRFFFLRIPRGAFLLAMKLLSTAVVEVARTGGPVL